MAQNISRPVQTSVEVLALTRNGTWLADGPGGLQEITHEPTRNLFARSLKWNDENGWFIHIGWETQRVQVEDTAFFVLRIEGSADTGYEIRLSDGTQERLDPTTLLYRPERLTCRIRGQPHLVASGRNEAKFLPAPYMDLLRDLRQDAQGYHLQIEGQRVQLASL